jgi:hypothetical protein
VTGGDVAAAITTGKPQVTPLPEETTGEAISYTRDGQFFLTASNIKIDSAHPNAILRYTPKAAGGTNTQAGSGTGGETPTTKGDTRNWWDKLSLEQVAYLVAAIGVIGLLMVVGGVVGIRRSRRQQRQAALAARSGNGNRGAAQVPGYPPPQQDGYPEPYEPYGNQYRDSYPPQQEYRGGSGYGEDYDYDQPGPRRPGDQHPGYQGGAYDDGYGGGYPHAGDGRGVGRAAPPRPPAGRGYPDGPGVYGGDPNR